MSEFFIVLGLFIALAWVIVRTVLMFLHKDARGDAPAAPVDPISTYVDENYGSHFVEDPVTANRDLRRL